jgi:Tfp pilus assembly protein PilN
MKPRRLDLDHVAPPRRARWPGFLVLAIAAITAGEVTQQYREAQLALERHQAVQGMLNVQRAPAKTIPKRELDEQTKNAEAVVRQLTLPWGRLIEALEETGGKDVAILQLQPDAQQRVLRVTAEARNQEAMVDYLRRLSEVQGFSYVHLLNHQVQQENPQRPIQFTAQASFKAMQ